ncbi:MAG TPA: cation:proton antiporter [Thermoleophilaceae bacterium]|nr:cation:proton antiporter [Thermoleophilaceae bacterium]
MLEVDGQSFLTIVVGAARAATTAGLMAGRLPVPVVVLEVVLGIMIGPQLLGLAEPDQFVDFFASLGLGMLFFFAGYEIDFGRLKGEPIKLALLGWGLSLVLAFTIGGLLAWAGVVLSLALTGAAMTTTAVGTLIPILDDAGELRTRFGTYLLGAGAVGEFGPILMITLFLSTGRPLASALILVAFVIVSVLVALVAVRSMGTGWKLVEQTMEGSGQLGVRLAVVLVFLLAFLAAELGLDLLLGGFMAGAIVRLALQGREVQVFESKLKAVGYGFFIPFFFVVSGVKLNVEALAEDPVQLLKLPLFLACFLVVRGAPALLLYRKALAGRDRLSLAFFSATGLPLIVAITTVGVERGEMRSSTAASLVAAGILSTSIFPLVGLKLRGDRSAAAAAP